ncbi:hypothetical protein MPTK1_7g00830 [Marchantia polymorpha subsp. ruderalis]|nr:hypothetical protein MARPO_0046s0041 [Marchantia polymorpha]BBN15787.1 hypothetical protein Mp_7g00830 [Marchantia polymorpha subsp. ruderalis]|eukprot:PTQ39219.1 hypothetical protein MARPO_0046s0041 [Marchantia polymorpha]
MANTVPQEFDPPLIQLIGEAFVLEYYHVLNNNPQDLRRYYGRSSTVTRTHSKVDDLVETKASTEEAMTKIISFVSGWKAEITSVISQEAFPHRVLILVTGYFSNPESVRRNFVQTFLLGLQNGENYLKNDVLRLTGVEIGEDLNCFSCTLESEENLRLIELHSAFLKEFKVIPPLDLNSKSPRQAVPPRISPISRKPVPLKHQPEMRRLEQGECFCFLPPSQPPQELAQAWAECVRDSTCSDKSEYGSTWEQLENIGLRVILPRPISTPSLMNVKMKDELGGHEVEETLFLDDETEYDSYYTFRRLTEDFTLLRNYPEIPINLYGSS